MYKLQVYNQLTNYEVRTSNIINICFTEVIQHFLAFIIRSTMQYIYVRLYFKNNYFPFSSFKNKTELHL